MAGTSQRRGGTPCAADFALAEDHKTMRTFACRRPSSGHGGGGGVSGEQSQDSIDIGGIFQSPVQKAGRELRVPHIQHDVVDAGSYCYCLRRMHSPPTAPSVPQRRPGARLHRPLAPHRRRHRHRNACRALRRPSRSGSAAQQQQLQPRLRVRRGPGHVARQRRRRHADRHLPAARAHRVAAPLAAGHAGGRRGAHGLAADQLHAVPQHAHAEHVRHPYALRPVPPVRQGATARGPGHGQGPPSPPRPLTRPPGFLRRPRAGQQRLRDAAGVPPHAVRPGQPPATLRAGAGPRVARRPVGR